MVLQLMGIMASMVAVLPLRQDVSFSALNLSLLVVCISSTPQEADNKLILHDASLPMTGIPYQEGVISQGSVHRCLPEGVRGLCVTA